MTAVKMNDARMRKISPAMPIKMRKHSANLLQQQQQQQQLQQQLCRQVVSPVLLILAETRFISRCAVLNTRVTLDWLRCHQQ